MGFIPDLPVFSIGCLLSCQDLDIFGRQFFHFRNLADTQLIKGLLGCLVKGKFFPVCLKELLAVTCLTLGFIGGAGFGIIGDVFLQRCDLCQSFLGCLD